MKINITLFIIIFFSNLLLSTLAIQYHCGTNNLKIKPKSLKPKIKIDKEDPSYKRRMADTDKDGFKSFNINIDKINIQNEFKKYKMEEYSDLILNALDKAAGTLQKLLKVKSLEDSIQFSNKDLNYFEIYNWDKNKFGDNAVKKNIDLNRLNIDLAIFPKIIEMEKDIIAAAMPIFFQEKNNQPVAGLIYINNQTNFSMVNIDKYLETTLIHEMTHVLGFQIEFFDKNKKR